MSMVEEDKSGGGGVFQVEEMGLGDGRWTEGVRAYKTVGMWRVS